MGASLPSTAVERGARWLQLPGGVFDAAGARHRDVWLRELTGADEELLTDRVFASGAQRASVLLARAIAKVEGIAAPIDEAFTAALSIGDRDALLLRLRQFEVGDHVHQVKRCGNPECGRKVDVDFLISELEVRTAEPLAPTLTLTLPRSDGSGELRLTLRLPTGADQEALAAAALPPAQANSLLLSRIVLDVDGRGPLSRAAAHALTLAQRNRIAEFLAQQAPGPDLAIDVACPYCAAPMAYDFDLVAFFLPSAR
ncbi:MAG: hypothetical protein ACK5TK_05975 [Betaproteobacteria bacterium]